MRHLAASNFLTLEGISPTMSIACVEIAETWLFGWLLPLLHDIFPLCMQYRCKWTRPSWPFTSLMMPTARKPLCSKDHCGYPYIRVFGCISIRPSRTTRATPMKCENRSKQITENNAKTTWNQGQIHARNLTRVGILRECNLLKKELQKIWRRLHARERKVTEMQTANMTHAKPFNHEWRVVLARNIGEQTEKVKN